MKVVWYSEAWKILENIYNYYAQRNIRAAANLYNDILDETDRLTDSPYIGVVEPLLSDYPKTLRSLVVREHYKVIYYVDEINQQIAIVNLWDCRQNPAKLYIKH